MSVPRNKNNMLPFTVLKLLKRKTPRKKTEDIKDTLKEICSDQITRTAVHFGSGSYGSCYLALCRGIPVVVEELRVKQLQRESREETELTVAQELIYKARLLNKPSDHPGPPLLSWGVHRAHTLSFDHANPRKSEGHLLYYIHCTFKEVNSRQDDLDKDHC